MSICGGSDVSSCMDAIIPKYKESRIPSIVTVAIGAILLTVAIGGMFYIGGGAFAPYPTGFLAALPVIGCFAGAALMVTPLFAEPLSGAAKSIFCS